MKSSFLKKIATCSIQVLVVIAFFAAVSFEARSQVIKYPDSIDTLMATSNSRMVVNVVEMGDSIKLEILGIGYLHSRTFTVSIAYDSAKLMLVDSQFLTPVTTATDSRMLLRSPSLPLGYAATNRSIGGALYGDMRYVKAGVGTSSSAYLGQSYTNGYTGSVWRVMPGVVDKSFTLFLKKKVPGTPISASDLGFYFRRPVPTIEPQITGADVLDLGYYWGIGSAYMNGVYVDYWNPDMFSFRWPSTVTTEPATEIAKTSATLNGFFVRGKFNPTTDPVSHIFTPLPQNGVTQNLPNTDLDWDAIYRCGFIWSDSDAVIVTDPFTKTITVDGTPYLITPADYTAGYFTVGLKTFWLKDQPNADASKTVVFDQPLTGLTQDQEYFAWAFMYYSFQTSETYINVGEKINFTPYDCAPPVPTGNATQRFCNSATVAELVATGVTGSTIKWYQNGVLLSSTTALANGIYFAKAELGGCISEDSLQVEVIIVRPLLSINVTGKDTTVCSTTSVTFNLTGMVTKGDSTDVLEFNEAINFNPLTEVTNPAAYTVAVNVVKTIYVRGYNAGLDCHSNAIDSITLRVGEASDESFTTVASGDTTCHSTTATVTVSTTIGNPTFRWYPSATATTPFFTGAVYTTSVLTADTTFWVSVEGVGYCEGAADATGRKEVFVKVLPLTIAADIDGVAGDTICYGNTATVTVSASGVAIPVYRWYASATATTPFFTGATYNTSILTADTTFWVSVEGLTEFCEGAANTTGRKAVFVKVLPLATESMVTISGNASICEGKTTTLTASASAVTTPIFRWYASATATTPFHTGATYTTSALVLDTTFWVSVEGLTQYCEGEASTAGRKQMTVNVTPTVVPTITINTTTPALCATIPVTFTSVITGGGNNPTYQWRVNGTNVAGETRDNFTYMPTHNDVVTCRLVSNAFCADPDTVYATPTTMTVYALPSAPTLVVDTLLADPFELIDLGLAVDSIPGMIYTYYENANKTGLIVGSEIIFDVDKDYYVTATDAHSCESAVKKIVVRLRCVAYKPVGQTTQEFCKISTVADLVAYVNNDESLKWFQNGEEIAFTDTLVNGVYYAKSQSILYGCLSKDSLTVIVTVHPEPPMHITGDTVLCADNTIRLIGNPTGGNWYSNNPSVATIDYNGYVKGIGAGMATFTYIYKHVTNCVYTLTHDVEVFALPEAGDIISANIDPICQGGDLYLEAVSEAGYTVVWYSDANLTNKVGTGTNVKVAGLPAGTYTYYAAAQNLLTGCIAPIANATAVVGVVYAAPTVSVITPGAYTSVNGTVWVDIEDHNFAGGTAVIKDIAIAEIVDDLYDNINHLVHFEILGKKQGNTELIYTTTDNNGCTSTLIIPVQVEGPPTGILLGKDIVRCNKPGGGDTVIIQIGYIMGGVPPWTVTVADDGGTFSLDTVINSLSALPVNITAIIPENLGKVPEFTSYRITNVIDALGSNKQTHYGEVRIGTNPTPRIDSIANRTQIVCAGQPTLPISFAGVATNYTWLLDKNIGSVNYSQGVIPSFIAENTGTTPIVATMVVTPEYWYNGVVCIGAPETVYITVNPVPVVNPITDITACSQSNIDVNFGGNTGGSYEWTFVSGTNVLPTASGNTIYQEQYNNTSSVPKTGIYSVVPIHATNSCRGEAKTFTITVLPNMNTATINPIASQVLCHNEITTEVTFSGSVPGAIYSWTNSDPTIGLAASGAGNILPFRAVNSTTLAKTAMINVFAKYTMNGVTCTATNAGATFTIKVDAIPSMPTVFDSTYCSGSIVPGISLTSNEYTWKQTGDNVGLTSTSGTGSISSFTATNNSVTPKTAVFEITPLIGNCAGHAITYKVTVLPNMNTATVSPVANQTLCHSEITTEVAFSGNVPGATYRWTNSDATIGLAAAGIGTILPFKAINTGLTTKTATITVTPEYTLNGATCAKSTAGTTFTITVDNLPIPTITNSTLCDGETVPQVTLPATYTWKLTGDNIGLGTLSGKGNIPQFTATNSTVRPMTATFEIVPTNGICQGETVRYSITVNPQLRLISATELEDMCSDTRFNYMVRSNVSNAAVSWVREPITGINGGLGAKGNTALIDEVLYNHTDQPVTVIYTIDMYYDGCHNEEGSITISVLVNPVPVLTVTPVIDVCQGDATAILKCELDELQKGMDVLYNITYDVNALLAGFANVNGTLVNEEITLTLPGFLPIDSYGATLKVASINGCINPTPYRFYIQIDENTRIVKHPESVSLCEADGFTLSVVATGKQLTYQWYRNGLPITGANASTYTVGTSDSVDYGNYYVEVSGLCGSETSKTAVITHNELLLLVKWTDVIFIANPGFQFVSYQWYKNGKAIGKEGKFQSYLEEGGLDGTYYVVAKYADGTTVTSCPRTMQKPPASAKSVFVYPNPAQPFSEITIDMRNYALSEVEGAKIEFIDMLGQYITEEVLKAPTQKVYLNLAKGVYMYRITTKADEVIVGKIVVY